MNAMQWLNNLRPALPLSIEQPCKEMSNGELRRHLKQGGVLINSERIWPDEEINFPVFSLVFFPKSKRRKTTIVYGRDMSDKPEALRLADEADDWRTDHTERGRHIQDAAAELRRQHEAIMALEAERDALLADAERYRWLRATTNFATNSAGERIDVRNKPDLWDAAIDAARNAQLPEV